MLHPVHCPANGFTTEHRLRLPVDPAVTRVVLLFFCLHRSSKVTLVLLAWQAPDCAHLCPPQNQHLHFLCLLQLHDGFFLALNTTLIAVAIFQSSRNAYIALTGVS